MAALQDFQESYFQCSICVERFTNPKVLKCQHTFCKDCIHLYIMQEVQNVPGRRGIPCPLCRTFTETDTTTPPDQWAEQLVTNFPLMNMMNSVESKVRVSKCEVHGKHVEYMCRSHQKKICSDCAVFEHRSCDIVASAALEKHEELLVDLTDKHMAIINLQDKFSTAISTLNENKDTMKNTLKEHFQNLREAVNYTEEKQVKMLVSKFEHELEDMEQSETKCRSLKDQSDEVLLNLKTCDGSSNATENCVGKAESFQESACNDIRDLNRIKISPVALKPGSYFEENLKRISESLGTIEVLATPENHYCPPENSVSTTLNNFQIIPQNDILSDQSHCFNPSTQYHCEGSPMLLRGQMGPPRTLPANQITSGVPTSGVPTAGVPPSLKIMNTFNARQPTDKLHCSITGAKFLTNGNIVLADKTNKKVKLFSSNLLCISAMATHTYPFDVTQVYTGDIAVTFPKENHIFFYNPDTLMMSNTFINTEQPCKGMVCIDDKLFVVCGYTWTKIGCIKVYDRFYNLIRKMDKDNLGKSMITVTEYLTCCPLTQGLVYKRRWLQL